MAKRKDPLGASVSLDISQLKQSIDEANRLIRENESQWRINASAMEDWTKEEKGLTGRIKVLDSAIESYTKNIKAITDEKEDLIKKGYEPESVEMARVNKMLNSQLTQLEKSRKEHRKLTSELEKLNEEQKDTSEELKDTTKESKKASKELAKLEDSAKDAGDGFTIAKGAIASFVGTSLTALVAMAGQAVSSLFNLTESTLEYRREMARVTTVAEQVGVSGDRIIDKWIDMNAVIQDESSVTEGLNNLMTAGFTAEKELDAITKALEGASIQWAETLKFEGLSDSLQEWIGSKGASLTGQFAELLERLGYNLDDVTEATKGMTDAQRRNWAIQILNASGLDKVSESYREANADMIEYNKANADLLNAQATLGENMQPFATIVKQGTADILYSFVDMANGVEGATDTLMANVSHLANEVWKGVKDVFNKLAPIFSDFITTDVPEFIGSIVAKIPSWIATIATTVWNEAPNIVSSLMDGIINGLNSLVEGIDNPIIEKILNDVISAFQWLSDNSGAVVSAIAGIVAGIATFSIIKNVTTWITLARGAIVALNVAMSANPIGLVVTAIAGLTAGLIALYNQCEPFRDWVDDMWARLKQFWDDCKVFFSNLGQAFSDFWTGLKNGFSEMLGWFSSKFESFKNIGSDIVNGIIAGIKSMASAIKDGAKWIYDHTIGAVLGFFGIKSPSTVMRDKVGKQIVSGIVEGIKSMLSTITDGARWVYDNTLGKLKGLFDGSVSLKDIGSNIVNGITSGIRSMGDAISSATEWIADNTIGRLKKWLGIASPSKVMASEIGTYISQGIAVGMKDGEYFIAESAEELAKNGIEVISREFNPQPIADAVSGNLAKAASAIDMGTSLSSVLKEGNTEENPTAIADEIFGIIGRVAGPVGQLLDSLWGFIAENLFGKNSEEVKEMAMQMVNNLMDTILSVFTNLPQIVSAGIEFIRTFAIGIIQGIPEIIKAVPQMISEMVTTFIGEGIPALFEVGIELIQGLIEGMFSINLWDVISSIGKGIVNGFKKLFGIKSPSRVMADEVGKNLALGMEEGLKDNLGGLNRAIRTGVDTSLKVDGIQRKQVNVYQTNNYAQAHSRYELYKSKHDTANAVRLALQGV